MKKQKEPLKKAKAKKHAGGRPRTTVEERLQKIHFDNVTIEKLAKRGFTDADIADVLGVNEVTVNRWKKDSPEFLQALKEAKSIADAHVEGALYHRAIGFQGSDKVYPPDATSIIFWLKNRKPDSWRDKTEQETDFSEVQVMLNLSGPTLKINPKMSLSFETPFFNQSRYLILQGGAGSGKSEFAARKILFRIMTEKNHKYLVLRKVRATLGVSVIALFLKLLRDSSIPFTFNKSDRIITIPIAQSTIIFDGLDDPEKIKSIVGLTSIWCEELTEFGRNDFAQIDLRLRGKTKHYKQIIGSFNPDEARGAWIKEDFCDNLKPDASVHESTVLDNPFIDSEYRQVLQNITDPVFRKIYLEGKWAAARGLIFENFKVIETLRNCSQKIYGIDFGFNDPTVLIEIGIDGQDLYLRELLHQPRLTTGDLIKKLDNFNIKKTASIYCDAAEPDRIEEIFRAGYRLVKPAKKMFRLGLIL